MARNKRPAQRAPVRQNPAPTKVEDKPEGAQPHLSITRQTMEWEGPLPPPQALEAFERVAPGSAQIIITEFVTEAHHRRELETKQGNLIFVDNFVGRASALLFAGGGFFVTYAAIVNDSPWVGAIVGGGMIVSGMTVLLKGRK